MNFLTAGSLKAMYMHVGLHLSPEYWGGGGGGGRRKEREGGKGRKVMLLVFPCKWLTPI